MNKNWQKSLSTLLIATASMVSFTSAYANDVDPDELLNLSLEQLSNIEVTSVSKTPEKRSEAAAAIYVITQEDIKNSGATEIPELFRMVPGMTVTRAGAHDWTVTSRGFNDQFSNKLLVLVDGRTVYSPLFSGVIWQLQDTVLGDIERIEVIRGPGATLWGANAVNGVINIITKHAKDTQGGYASFTAGNMINGIGSVRYGVKTADNSYIRAYAKSTNYRSEDNLTDGTANDNWSRQQAGFRSDSTLSDTAILNVQGDAYSVTQDKNYLLPDTTVAGFYSSVEGVDVVGGNLQGRLEKDFSVDSKVSLQVYVDSSYYKTSFFNDLTTTADLDLQHSWTRWDRHEVVWGAGYRFIQSKNNPTSQQYALDPQVRNDNLWSAFVQDKIELAENEFFLTLGTKFEHNAYTGVEIQPSARFSWLLTDNQTLWGSVSRAVHTPSRSSDDSTQTLSANPGVPAILALDSNRGLESEEMIAYELGYRIQPTSNLAFDLATFYNDYDKLFHNILGAVTVPGAYLRQASYTINGNQAKSMGFELSAKYNPTNEWQLAGAYSYINLRFDRKDSVGLSFVGKHPKHQFNIRSTYNFPYDITMNNALYYVDDLNGVGVDGYYRFDTRLAYLVTDGVEVSLVGQNLIDEGHQEFSPFAYTYPAEIGRSVYGNVKIEF